MFSNLKNLSRVIALVALMAAPFAQAKSVDQVWQHHIDAWQTRALDEIVEDYTEDSVLVLNNQSFKGKEQITKVFTQLFQIFDDGTNRIDSPVVFDRFVYLTWHFTPSGEPEHFGTDTFVIENGKIVLQTIASTLYKSHPIVP